MTLEQFEFTGGNLLSTEKEIRVNDILMKIKREEVAEGMETGKFPPAMHFFRAKQLIEQSRVFDILRKMPKGKTVAVCFINGELVRCLSVRRAGVITIA